jgi:hypothetical protein
MAKSAKLVSLVKRRRNDLQQTYSMLSGGCLANFTVYTTSY